MPPVPRLSSSTYWIPPSRRLSVMNSTGTSSTSRSSISATSDTLPRNYIDPWDLENYAYLRRHCADLQLDPTDSDPVISLSTNGLDSAHSDFYFVPARQPLAPIAQHPRGMMMRGLRRPSLMVVPQEDSCLEEEDFYNARCEMRTPCCHQRPRRHSVAAQTLHHPTPPPYLQDHLLPLHQGGPCDKSKARQLTSAEEPPPLVYVYQTPRLNRKTSRQINRELIPPMTTSSEENDDLYDELASLARRRSKMQQLQQQQAQQQFGLSTFGHLKIDYSCNWNNLDRYITHT